MTADIIVLPHGFRFAPADRAAILAHITAPVRSYRWDVAFWDNEETGEEGASLFVTDDNDGVLQGTEALTVNLFPDPNRHPGWVAVGHGCVLLARGGSPRAIVAEYGDRLLP